MKRKLEQRLQDVADFEEPDVELEQYRTPASVAAHLLALADLNDDVEDRVVVDLGTGTGMLAIGAGLLAPSRVVGIDIDESALEIARENERSLAPGVPVAWIRGDARRIPLRVEDCTVVANPPFGAQKANRHADRDFFETIREIARVSYTIHNAGSQEFVEAYSMDHGGRITHAYRVEFQLPRRFDFHEADSATIQAELYRIEWSGN